jgi:hypothetical protein
MHYMSCDASRNSGRRVLPPNLPRCMLRAGSDILLVVEILSLSRIRIPQNRSNEHTFDRDGSPQIEAKPVCKGSRLPEIIAGAISPLSAAKYVDKMYTKSCTLNSHVCSYSHPRSTPSASYQFSHVPYPFSSPQNPPLLRTILPFWRRTDRRQQCSIRFHCLFDLPPRAPN